MRTALFLIALGFGYKIFAEASQQKTKNLQKLGQWVGTAMMLISILGALFLINAGTKGMCSMKNSCPFMGNMNQAQTVATPLVPVKIEKK